MHRDPNAPTQAELRVLAPWIAAGIRRLEQHLGKQAAFAAYCRRRDARRATG